MSLAIPMVDIPAGATRILGSLTANEQPLPLQGVPQEAAKACPLLLPGSGVPVPWQV